MRMIMHEKVNNRRNWLIDTIVARRNCDTLQERKELRASLRDRSEKELFDILNSI